MVVLKKMTYVAEFDINFKIIIIIIRHAIYSNKPINAFLYALHYNHCKF